MNRIGQILALITILAAAVFSIRSYAPYGLETALGIALGATSLIAMSLALILSTRLRPLEPFFGGLDKVYQFHKWLGIAALALMIGHNLMEPELEDFVQSTQLGEFAADVGEIALNGFIGLILISWIKRIPFTRLELPWPIWRFTHRFTGLLFAIAAFHQFAVDKPVGIDPSLTLYLNIMSAIGVLAWLYTEFLAPFLRLRTFVVEHVNRHGSVTEMTLRPKQNPMHWKPGQFAFVSAPHANLQEAHPFTIASAPTADGRLRFGIKALGGWTKRFPRLVMQGESIHVQGPYGRFVFRKRVRRQVWLAGGIGITPFLAWAEALSAADRQEIALIWVVANRTEAFAADRLAGIAAQHPQLTLHICASAEEGRLTAQRLVSLVPFEIRDSELFYCGPIGLRDSIVSGLKAMGHSPRRIHWEDFEFR